MDEEKKVKLTCHVCDATYWADRVIFSEGADVSPGSLVPYTCPVCNHEESKVEE
jgi:hypothetical protein